MKQNSTTRHLGRKRRNLGSAIVGVAILILLLTIGSIVFMNRTTAFLSFTGMRTDSISAQYQLDSAHELAKAKLERAMDGILLSAKLQYVGGPAYETFTNLSNTYSSNTLGFLQALVRQQAYSSSGVLNSSNEFASWSTAFPSTWTDPNPNDNQYYEVKYTFTPLEMVSQVSPQTLTFEYEYRVQARSYGQSKFQTAEAEDAGVISISVAGAPFSQWAAFMDSMKNQSGSTLVFAGGNSSAQIQEVYSGPVHVNQTPNFYGHPVFTDLFTSATALASWVYYSVSGYTGCPSQCPTFGGGKQGGVTSISMPTQIFNTMRLASGDTSTTAATNNTTVSNSELRGFLATHASGTVTAGSTAVPDNIYIPVDNSSSLTPTGGIYVQGDARIQMNVVQGSSDFSSTQWSQMNTSHQTCKFQKLAISSLTSGVAARDIYVGDDPCNVTYVYDATTPTNLPVVLNGRINGNLHVSGSVDQLGGASRTRPAIAQDFAMTISSAKDLRIISDLQYEDAYYVTQAADGTQGTTSVATPTGAVGGSGILPTSADVAPKISSSSTTALGLISTGRNVTIHSSAPANINIHAAIYAGNSAAYNSSTGLGCGASGANTQGCGFGYEAWSTATGMGNIKFLGSLSEYKDQTTGVLSTPPKGYGSRYYYDTRLRQSITPPAFPVSNTPAATASIRPYRTWRISKLGN